MEEFIKSTALIASNHPEPYGVFHLLVTLIGLPLMGLLAWKLKDIEHSKADKIIFGIGLYLCITEIYKQLFHYYVVSRNVFGVFPGYLCSLPMYICALFPIIKNKKPYLCFLELFNFLGGFLAFAEPSGILDTYWNNTVHSVIWHLLLVFIGFYIMFSGRGAQTKEDYYSAVKIFFRFCVISLIVNIVMYRVSAGEVNCLYMGPGKNYIIVYSSIYDKFGPLVCTPIWVWSLCRGAYIIFVILKLFSRGGHHYVAKNYR